MSMDDCFLPLPSPLHERWRRGSHPCLSQLDLDERAVAGFGTAGEGCSHGVPGRILRSPNRTVAVPPRCLSRPLDPLPMYKGNPLPVFPEEPKQHQVTVSRAASKGRYARFKENLNAMPEDTKKHNHSQVNVSCATSKGRSQAGWISKDRSTPEGINMVEHAWRFRFSMPRPKWTSKFDPASVRIPVVMQKKKPPEVRNALRERSVAAKQKDACYHAEVALRKYNRANKTKFELVQVKVISIFSEFGGAGAHYNFTAKQAEDQHSVDADCTSYSSLKSTSFFGVRMM